MFTNKAQKHIDTKDIQSYRVPISPILNKKYELPLHILLTSYTMSNVIYQSNKNTCRYTI